jgi:hypothetical protein
VRVNIDNFYAVPANGNFTTSSGDGRARRCALKWRPCECVTRQQRPGRRARNCFQEISAISHGSLRFLFTARFVSLKVAGHIGDIRCPGSSRFKFLSPSLQIELPLVNPLGGMEVKEAQSAGMHGWALPMPITNRRN